ncbi:ATP-binding cassette subfamily C protein CydD/ATP-binding cassette subfamily C protein CydCD [Amycolatopsis sulphurea]|uniref:ATP-binding cassette subfamily C protein CydD/ATP-binding cassette subfamily C protein CydCD n=1 Tax=Amycolatopsis sulphurea TaxID=76022 RepID=A0A2A9FBL7_9PSEU|nr:ATP-binding cassette subfamily C protein CydD/ATP-binding cassette subfamily C protein CydCD [Amycolatopsis sulphurea]
MTTLPGRAPLSATWSTVDPVRPGKGPLGALPALGPAARRALILVALLSLLNTAFVVAQAILLADVLASIVSSGAGGRTAQLATLFAFVAGRALAGWAVRVVSARAAATAQRDLRARAVDHALQLGPEWLARRGHGELTTLVTRGLDALDAYFREYLPALITAAVVPLATGAAILWTDWPSAVIIAGTVPLLPFFAVLVGKFTADRVSGATDAVHRMSGLLLELVRALPVLTAFRRAGVQAETVRKLSERHRRATLKTLRVAFSSAFVLELAATLSVALVAVVIGVRLVSGSLPLAVGLAVLILAPECYQPIRAVGAAFHASEDGVEAVCRVSAVLAEPAPPAGNRTAPDGSLVVADLKVARRQGFAPDGESFSVRRGEIVWLRAPSGGGKSTTLATLLGFVPSYDGSVQIGGVPLPDVDLARWRADVAWVPQSPVFTGGTVREELAVAGADIGEMLVDLGLSGLADRPVDQLSLGQRQRVAVARALLRVRSGAWLLLLDEPTAHLDEANARRVLDAVDKAVANGAAAVIAAHERSTAVTVVDEKPLRAVENPVDELPGQKPLPWRLVMDRRLLGGAVLGAVALLAGIALTATSGWLIAKASLQPPILTLTVAVVGVRAFGLGRAGLRYAERLVTHDAAFRIAARLRVRLWNALVRQGPARSLSAGESQRRLVTDIDTVRDLLPRVVSPPIVVGLVAIGAIAVQTAVLPSAGLVLAVAVLAGLAAPLVAVRVERRATSTLAAGRRDVGAQVLVLFSSAAELLAYGLAATRRRTLGDIDTRLMAASRRQAFGAGAGEALITLVTGAAAVVSATLAAQAVTAGQLAGVMAPLLALVPLALAEVLAMLPQSAVHGDTLRTARIRLAAVDTSTDGHPHVDSLAEHPVDGTDAAGRDESVPVVRLRGAELGWPGGPAVLEGVDLEVPAGAYVAVVGASGAGKSTLVAAMLGFLAPRTGEVVAPGRVAWAPQEPMLVSTTVAENLRLADPRADSDELRRVLDQAQLPDLDLATVLDSAGAGLSGGQAQRVSVARALLAAPEADLVLLDEPTSQLDEPTARALRAALRSGLAGRTVVHVTHSAEEEVQADLVFEVRDGRVVRRVAPLVTA